MRRNANKRFDINRSSFFRFIKEQREDIRRHQANEVKRTGEALDTHAAIHSWFRRHRWDLYDPNSDRHQQ
ncbi:hypothetical protein [Cerasicoccus maritimus]|uniref:hypothetical protein n=1 Tax=Cerasicoccus maritimus TaxID=490089 RepID=UPI002852A4D6|nr:hypothetical protein [Cerasicoccus maritimus]